MRRSARPLEVFLPAALALAAALAGPRYVSAEETPAVASDANPLRTESGSAVRRDPNRDTNEIGSPVDAGDPSLVISGTAVTFEIGELSGTAPEASSEVTVDPAVLSQELLPIAADDAQPLEDAELFEDAEPFVDAETLDPADLELEESDLRGETASEEGHPATLGEDTDNPAFAGSGAIPLRTPKDPLLEVLTPKPAEEPMIETEDEGEPQPLKRAVKPILIDPLPKRSTDLPVENPRQDRSNALDAAAPEPAAVQRMRLIDATLQHYRNNPESVAVRSPWAVMHALLPYGRQAELWAGPNRVNAIEWMCANRVCRTQTIFSPVGRSFRPNVGGGVQGHQGQFLAILAQSKVSSGAPLTVSGRDYTVSHLVQYEMATCRPNSELTFKLIGLSYYLGTRQNWRSADRQTWNVERLVGEELVQPVNGAACGGTHRLMGLSFALAQRRAERMPLSGNYAKAQQYIDDYIDYTWSLQNPDGSFSTNWFESRGMDPDDERKVQTTGHMLEWLVFANDPAQLRNAQTEAAVDYLISQVYDRREHAWPIGPRGHALRALALYREKMLPPVTSPSQVNAPQRSASRSSTATPARSAAPSPGRTPIRGPRR